jgi:PilZ domain-containing protein
MRGATGLKPVSFAVDMIGMDSTTRVPLETRKAMMAIASVTWEDEDETVHTARARIEDMSVSGARFRLKIPIRAGTKVEVSWCRDEFTGATRWCREEHGEYLVGLQRDKIASKVLSRNVPGAQALGTRQADVPAARRVHSPRMQRRDEPDVSKVDTRQVNETQYEMPLETRQEVWTADPPIVPAPVPEIVQSIPPERRAMICRETLIPIQKPAPLPLLRITFPPAVIQKPLIGFEIAVDNSRDSGAPYPKRTTSFFEQRTGMPNKWINPGSKSPQ